MQLTNKQYEGLKTAVERYKQGCKFTIIAGYAGTGKSTLIRSIIETLDIDENLVCYCAFTGKAAEVLRQKGNKNVCTLHKLLYQHIPLPNGKFIRKKKTHLEYKIVIVDEISMCPASFLKQLLSYDIYMIGLGDSYQLPQISKEEVHNFLEHPHIFLDEVMRQAQESEIIRLTMKIRNGEPINYFNGKDVKIISYKELNTGVLKWGDQILTATNKKREQINTQMRRLLGKEGDPQDGEKIICLRNYWDELSMSDNALVNGTVGILQNSFKTWREIPRKVYSPIRKFDVITGDLYIPGINDIYKNIEIDHKMITTNQNCCDWKLAYRLGKLKNKYGEIVPKEFAFAYAITYWKAQGSEWNKVVILEEKFPFDKKTHMRALYTAATRASKKLVWVK